MGIIRAIRIWLWPVLVLAMLGQAGCNSYVNSLMAENAVGAPYYKAEHHPEPKNWPSDRLTVSWIGHATVLINCYGTTILTDPLLGERTGPDMFGVNAGLRRISELPLKVEDIPPIDAVLLSHAHYDHWDVPSLRQLADRTGKFIVPQGDLDILPAGGDKAVELAWGKSVRVKDVTITAVHVEHWGARPFCDPHFRGYNGYVIAGRGRTVFFSGDTRFSGYENPSEVIDWPARTGTTSVDICILPIGEYRYYPHMHPRDGWEMFNQLHGRYFLPVHWRTLILTPRALQPIDEPMELLLRAAGPRADALICRQIGQTFVLPEDSP